MRVILENLLLKNKRNGNTRSSRVYANANWEKNSNPFAYSFVIRYSLMRHHDRSLSLSILKHMSVWFCYYWHELLISYKLWVLKLTHRCGLKSTDSLSMKLAIASPRTASLSAFGLPSRIPSSIVESMRRMLFIVLPTRLNIHIFNDGKQIINLAMESKKLNENLPRILNKFQKYNRDSWNMLKNVNIARRNREREKKYFVRRVNVRELKSTSEVNIYVNDANMYVNKTRWTEDRIDRGNY